MQKTNFHVPNTRGPVPPGNFTAPTTSDRSWQLAQSHYRFRNDDGTEVTATWMAAVDTVPAAIQRDTLFRLRVALTEIAGSNVSFLQYPVVLEWRQNSGPWLPVGTTNGGAIVQYADSPNVTSGTLSTQQITAGGFQGGFFRDVSGTDQINVLGLNSSEWEYGLNIGHQGGATVADVFDFRLTFNGAPLDVIQQSPSVSLAAVPAKTGSGVSSLSSISDSNFVLNKTGAGASTHNATGADVDVFTEIGEAVFGPSRKEFGAGVRGHSATGSKAGTLLNKTGHGDSSHNVAGAKNTLLNETLIAVSTHNASGGRVHEFAGKPGHADLTGSAKGPGGVLPANTVLPVLSGTPEVGQTLSVSTGTWTGQATPIYTYQWEELAAGGSDWIPIGFGSFGFGDGEFGGPTTSHLISALEFGAQIRVLVTATNGAGSVSVYSNILAVSETHVETGHGGTGLSALGADALTDVDTAAGISAHNALGADVFTGAETAAGVSAFNSTGGDVDVPSETGAGVTAFGVAGAQAAIDTNAGAGVTGLSALGAKALIDVNTGAGVITLNASGVQVYVAGSGSTTYSKTGAGVSQHDVLGADVLVSAETGNAASDFNSAAAKAYTEVNSGTGASTLNSSASRIREHLSTGSAITVFTESGVKTLFYSETAGGVSAFSEQGAKVGIYSENGHGDHAFVGMGLSHPVPFIINVYPFDPPNPVAAILNSPHMILFDPPKPQGGTTSDPSTTSFDPPEPVLR